MRAIRSRPRSAARSPCSWGPGVDESVGGPKRARSAAGDCGRAPAARRTAPLLRELRKLQAAASTRQRCASRATSGAAADDKAELIADQAEHPPWGSILRVRSIATTRYCQTFDDRQPAAVGRYQREWQWLVECWKHGSAPPGPRPADRVFFPFSFGQFLGSGRFDAGSQMG